MVIVSQWRFKKGAPGLKRKKSEISLCLLDMRRSELGQKKRFTSVRVRDAQRADAAWPL